MIDWAVMKMRQSNRNRVVLKSPGLESLNENFLDHHRPLHRNDENDHLSSSSQKNFHERTISSSICPTIASIVWRPLWPPGELSELFKISKDYPLLYASISIIIHVNLREFQMEGKLFKEAFSLENFDFKSSPSSKNSQTE